MNKGIKTVQQFLSKGTIEKMEMEHKQGRIHGKTVADGLAGAVMQKPLAIQKYLGPTDRHGKV